MPAPPCLFCLRRVYQNSRAVTCDNCSRWHHIKCGNTGITDEQYDAAVAENRDLQFVCLRCRHNNTDENGDLMDEIVNSIPDSKITTIESTATSAMSLLEEEMDVDDAFDITRPERELPSEDMENSLHDATVTDIAPTAPVTYTIVGSGTERGKPKLASSDGYLYVVKRELKSGDDV